MLENVRDVRDSSGGGGDGDEAHTHTYTNLLYVTSSTVNNFSIRVCILYTNLRVYEAPRIRTSSPPTVSIQAVNQAHYSHRPVGLVGLTCRPACLVGPTCRSACQVSLTCRTACLVGRTCQPFCLVGPTCRLTWFVGLTCRPACLAGLTGRPACLVGLTCRPACFVGRTCRPAMFARLASLTALSARLVGRPAWFAPASCALVLLEQTFCHYKGWRILGGQLYRTYPFSKASLAKLSGARLPQQISSGSPVQPGHRELRGAPSWCSPQEFQYRQL